MENEVLNIDCMNYMKTIPDKFFDLAICDPNYGIFDKQKVTGFVNREYKLSQQANKWDIRPDSDYFKELFRVSKDQIIFGMQYFTKDLPNFSQLIIWDKGTGESFFADGEAAYCSIKGTLRIFRHQWCGCFKDSEKRESYIQPCQKPIALYLWLLENYAKPNFKIFDSHVGSGSLRIACYMNNLYFKGCEINPVYWKQQEDRFLYEKNKIDQKFYIPEEENLLFSNI